MKEIGALYARHALRFDEARSRELYEQPYLDAALSAMPATSRILDLGCGAGEPIARYFVERGHHVTGVDVAGPMIELCRRRMPEMNWLHTDMRSLELEERFDLVIAWDSFLHLSGSLSARCNSRKLEVSWRIEHERAPPPQARFVDTTQARP